VDNRFTGFSSPRPRPGSARPGHPRTAVALAIALAAASWAAPACRADLVIEAPDVTLAPGSSGSFDVLITSTGGSFDVASDTVELTLSGLSGVSFTGASIATITPYIYGADSATTTGSTFTFSSSPGTTLEVFDFLLTLGAQTIGAGDVFGLVNVTYSVDPGATPGASGTLALGTDTSLADAVGNNVSFTALDGSITIASAVPEPTSVVLLAVGGIAFMLVPALKRTRDHAGRP
jgi:hypothetical protein